MAEKIKILGIAPFNELENAMIKVGQSFPEIQLDVKTADLTAGIQLAQSLQERYDLIISRGGTAKLLKNTVDLPVIDISISLYDVLGTIKLAENYHEKFAIVGFPSITRIAHLVCSILKYDIQIVTVEEEEAIPNVLGKLKSEGYNMVLCDTVTHRIALTIPMNTILITSGTESIKEAFEQAIDLYHSLAKSQEEKQFYKEALLAQDYPFMIFDSAGSLLLSTVTADYEAPLSHYLQKKVGEFDGQNQVNKYYHSVKGDFFIISPRTITVLGKTYYLFRLKQSANQFINNRLGIHYQSSQEITRELADDFYGIPGALGDLPASIAKFSLENNPIIIYGEKGTGKTQLGKNIYLTQGHHKDALITVDCALLEDKMWKQLTNPYDGPLVSTENTILFQHVEHLDSFQMNQLIAIIKDTRLVHRSRLLFTYTLPPQAENESLFTELNNQLYCLTLMVPPLRARTNEFATLSTFLLNRLNALYGKKIIGFEPAAAKELAHYPWPGNYAQLRQVLTELILMADEPYITGHQVMQILEKNILTTNVGNDNFAFFNHLETRTLKELTQEIIQLLLDKNEGNQTKTAKQLGISRTTMWRYLNENNTNSTTKPK